MRVRTPISLNPLYLLYLYAHFLRDLWPCRCIFSYILEIWRLWNIPSLGVMHLWRPQKTINFVTSRPLVAPPSVKINNRYIKSNRIDKHVTKFKTLHRCGYPCGYHKCMVLYRIFYSFCDPPEKKLQLRHFIFNVLLWFLWRYNKIFLITL